MLSYNFIVRVHNTEDWVLTSHYAYHKAWRSSGLDSHIIVRVDRRVYDDCVRADCLQGLENDPDYTTIVVDYKTTTAGVPCMMWQRDV